MKKINSIALLLILVLILAGCGSQTAETTSAAAATTAAVETSAGGNYSVNIVVDADTDTAPTVDGLEEELCSWTQGGQDADTVAGNDYAFTPVVYISDGSFDSEKSLTDEQISSDVLTDTSITVNQEAVNGVMVSNSDYEIESSSVVVNADSADGSTTCDFSGLGSALAVYKDSDVVVKDTVLEASGVANMGLFVDNGAEVLLDNVTVSSSGGTLYSDYVNSPAQETMVAPPWILGIMGNSRCSNLMGDNSTLTVVDSEASASNWAVLSTDSGSNMVLNAVNSTLSLTGSDKALQADGKFDTENPYTSCSGYGSYVIGNAVETFLGDTLNVGTYAAIFTGGSATYGNLVKGESYELSDANGSTHTTYDATEDVQTVINSDTFGFMAHQNTNTCTLDGVQVNSEFTDFLVKSGTDTTINVENNAELNAGNGILLQLLDNDDSTTEFDSATMAFGETHEEYAGFPTEAVADSTTAADHMKPSDLPEGGNEVQDPANMGGDIAGSTGDDSQTPPEIPTGDMGSGDIAGGTGDDGQTPPEIPTGDMADNMAGGTGGDDQTPPEKPTGDMSGGDMGGGDMAGGSMGDGGSSSVNTTVYNVVDTDLEGAIYNGIGWNANELSSGNVKQMQLKVNLSGDSTLKGAIAMTSCIHATYDGQVYLKENGITAFDDDAEAAAFAEKYQAVSFSQAEYFNIGQVANLVKSNGLNNIDVNISDNAVWTVTDTSLVTSVTLSGNASVVVEKDVTLTVNGKEYTEGTYTASDF